MSTFPYDENEPRAWLFCRLERMLRDAKDDPAQLAVVVTAYEKEGWWHPQWSFYGVSDTEGIELVNAALRGRHKRLLRAKADGLLLGLRATAAEAERWRVLQVQLDSAVVEVRQLPTEERIEKLRAIEAAGA